MSTPKPTFKMPVRNPKPWLSSTQKHVLSLLLATTVMGSIVGAHHFTVHSNPHQFPLTTLSGMAKGALIGATWPLWTPFIFFIKN